MRKGNCLIGASGPSWVLHGVDPHTDNSSSADDIQAPKQQPLGRISVKLPNDEWLCRKMDKLNVTLVEGYPSRASEGLQKDKYVKLGKSQLTWYRLHPSTDKTADTVSFWGNEWVKLNSSYSRIARYSGLATLAPASRPLSQYVLRRWEKSAREASYICNQAAGFSRCLSKVQSSMQVQLRKIQSEQSKGKSSEKTSSATDELQYLMNFNSRITQCMAKTMHHLSEFVFINVANMTLARRDAYLAHVKAGIKQDTLSALRQAPIHLDKLFPDQTLKRAEEDIAQFENKGRPAQTSSNYRKDRLHPYKGLTRVPEIRGPANRPGKTLVPITRKERARPHISQHIRPRVSLLTSDNQCVKSLLSRRLTESKETLDCTRYHQTGPESGQTVNLNVVSHAHFVGQPQKKVISPLIVKQKDQKLKCVNNVSCVDQLCSVKLAQNVPLIVQNLTIGARINQFWDTSEILGAGPKVIQMLKEGYTLPFQTRPNLTRNPTIVSCYVNPHRNLYLLEALHQLTNKNAKVLVSNQESLGFYNWLFLVPKPNNKWRPY